MPDSMGLAGAAALFLIFLILGELSYFFVIPPSSNAVFWLPSGLTFALFVRARWTPRIWPFLLTAIFLGELLVVWIHQDAFEMMFVWSAANVFLPLTTAFLARRLVFSPFDFRRLRDVMTFIAIVPLAVFPGAILAAAGSALSSRSPFISTAISWAASDALGIVLIAPVILSWTTPAPRTSGRYPEAIVLFVALTVSSVALFFFTYQTPLDPSLLSFLFFYVAWAAIRFGSRGTSVALLVINIIEVAATRIGLGPFASPEMPAAQKLLNLQILVTNIGLLMLFLAAAIEEQRAARMTAETALKSRDDFLSIASHELKTPLTSFAMQVQMINRLVNQSRLGSVSMEKLANLARISEQELQRFSSLINDLLDVSRISAGRLALNPEEVDLTQTVRDVVDRFHLEAANNRSSIHVCGDPGIVGYWDRLRIEQVVSNLVSNALKFGAGKPIEITTERRGDKASVTVTDHGIGISKEDQSRIFERFERAVSLKRFGGLGLGLFIVHQIVNAHGGSIRVESEVDRYSSFTVELPLKTSPEARFLTMTQPAE
jgi:signal transduction histidine kinase